MERQGAIRSILLIDGEHYPAVTARAIGQLISEGEEPSLALMVGGKEKIGEAESDFGIAVEWAADDPEAALAGAIDRTGAGLVLDISDEPVLGYVERCRLASVALWKGARYRGADFEFTPPERPVRPNVASVAVFGSGKRAGKTAVSGAAARVFDKEHFNPVVVAMGRGGPPEPETLETPEEWSPHTLVDLAQSGRHAASDYIEDALTARVPTVGAWRAGGGLAGGTRFGNYPAAIQAAQDLHPGLLVLEGSGSAIPPAMWDAGILVVDARIDPAYLCGYFGLYRVLLADLVVLTMCEESVDSGQLSAVEQCIRSCTFHQPTAVRTVFRPYPLGDISGKRVWFGTTASEDATEVLTKHLAGHYDAEVVGVSHALADRARLLDDLAGAGKADVLLLELKAAAVDVATEYGIEQGMEVVYVDNRPQDLDADEGTLDTEFVKTARLAGERSNRTPAEDRPGAPT